MNLVILVILFGLYQFTDLLDDVKPTSNNQNKEEIDKTKEVEFQNATEFEFVQNGIQYNLQENLQKDIKIEFCPGKQCFDLLNESFYEAKFEIKCALYELDEDNLAHSLLDLSQKGINISLVIDDRYLEEDSIYILANSTVKIFSDIDRGTRFNNYMHSKFCVIDDKLLITGSTNPTNNGFYKNNNNLVKIYSQYLSQNYQNEFDQLNAGKFGQNKHSVLEYNNLTFNFEDKTYKISSYMCPQDDCMKQVTNLVDNAQTEVLFATFAMTNDDLENSLLEASKRGIKVEGVVESRNRNTKGSIVMEMNKTFPIHLDKNKNNMHHKFFVIDEKYLVTGSMNPSKSGNMYNDENILVIESSELALLYKEEFLGLVN